MPYPTRRDKPNTTPSPTATTAAAPTSRPSEPAPSDPRSPAFDFYERNRQSSGPLGWFNGLRESLGNANSDHRRIDEQLDALRSNVSSNPDLSDLQKRQFGATLDLQQEMLAAEVRKGMSLDDYTNKRREMVDKALNVAGMMGYQAIGTKKTALSGNDRLAIQSALADIVNQETQRARADIEAGNEQLLGYANNVGGQQGNAIRAMAARRAQDVNQMNMAWLQGLQAQYALEPLTQQMSARDQIANQLAQQAFASSAQQGIPASDPLSLYMGMSR